MSKIEIQVGQVRVHSEGDDNYIKTELPALIDKLILHSSKLPEIESENNDLKPTKSAAKSGVKVGTTNSIAQRINAKTGTDLFTAAAAKLHFVDKKESFSRKELLTEIRSATQYFSESYVGNGSKILLTLGKNTLNEIGKDKFALTAKAIADLEPKLAA
jgi:hypothetical protein